MNKDEFLSNLTYDRSDDLKNQVIDNMVKYGGSFVKALADCAIKADYSNFGKLVDAFEDYFWDYRPEKFGGKNG